MGKWTIMKLELKEQEMLVGCWESLNRKVAFLDYGGSRRDEKKWTYLGNVTVVKQKVPNDGLYVSV